MVRPMNLGNTARRIATLIAVAACALTGCSLLTIKSPEIPLTPREQEARLLTRDYAANFASTFVELIDEAHDNDREPGAKAQLLKFKLGVVTEITRASTGLSPIGSLLDTWAFSIQLRDFLTSGDGAKLVGGLQPELRQAAVRLADEADALGRKVTGNDYARYRTLVMSYAERYVLKSADLTRPSILSTWINDAHEQQPLREVGTVAQALGDVADRVRIYSERVPSMGLWQAELALDRAGVDDASYRNALRNIDAQLERISKLADTSPELAHEAIGELRSSLRASSDRLDVSWMKLIRTLGAEREALAVNIATERQGITAAFDTQRALISADAAQITARVVDTSWREIHRLVREALLLAILLVMVVMGLPFVAGYFVGRRRSLVRP